MDAATIRLHELNEELRNIDISEYHYIDGALVELKLVPQDVEILDPILYYLRHYTVEELWTKIKVGTDILYTFPTTFCRTVKEFTNHHLHHRHLQKKNKK